MSPTPDPTATPAPTPRSTPEAALARLATVVADIGPLVVGFSGGVDSSLLAVAAARTLGPEHLLAVTADSASLGTGELDHCRHSAATWGVAWTAVNTTEFDDSRYLANNGDRCYWCKSALMDQLEPLARAREATVALGVNLDDLGDHRPGQEAAAARGARFPLVEAGFTKALVRATALELGLEVWDRPAMPCLSSRLPYGTAVTVPILSRVDRAEGALRRLGFSDVRVRHYDDTARIELPAGELGRAVDRADDVVAAVTGAGYRYVTLDLAGLRSGNLNQALAPPAPGQAVGNGSAGREQAAGNGSTASRAVAVTAERN